MIRIGETVKKNVKYYYRPGIYGIIKVNDNILLTEQNEKEIQLPGGGIDKGEHYITALVREVYEETGWKIQPINRLGFFHRFVYMPEYSKWAQKVCHIYLCKGLYNLTSPLEIEKRLKIIGLENYQPIVHSKIFFDISDFTKIKNKITNLKRSNEKKIKKK